ncbi:hypothetical protein U9M48_021738 [Paspalum notatum var. saurae]|uniref:Uncharacterized protein n=1 Tax=Paspalum notatum var. saurae TaxID=547442 RepID=A0AAQ3TJN4_PASNO
MELLHLPCRAASARPALLPTIPSASRRASASARPAAASSSNVEVIDTDTASSSSGAAARTQWRAGGLGLELELSEEMRRGMMWRMLAPPAAAVAADAAFLRLLERAGDAPAWAATAGSAALFAVGLFGVHYGFLSSRWDDAERGSVVGWDLAVRHWNVLSMAKGSSNSSSAEEEEDEEEYEDDEEEYEDDDEEYEDDDDEEVE